MYTINEKVPPTASNRRKRELAREGDLLTYKRKRKTIDSSTVVPPNTVDSANEGVCEGVNIPTESVEGVNIPQGSEFETESAQAGLGAQPPLPNVCPDFDENIPIFGGYSECEGATSNDDVGPSDKSLLRSFRFHRARSIVLGQDLKAFKSLKVGSAGNSLSLKKLKSHYVYKLEKVLSDGTAAAAKKKKGLTTRSVAHTYMLYILGYFLFPTKNGTDVSPRYLVLFAKDKVAKKWSWGSASWIFAHFPKLGGIPKEMDSDAYEHCTCWKWDVSVTDRYGGTALLHFKEALDNYKLEDVVWDPNKDKRDSPHALKEVNFFYGTLASPDHVQPYCPNRVVRQFNREQGNIPTKKPVNVNEHGDTPVHQSEDITEQYDASHHEHSSRSPNINLNDQQITALNNQLQKLKEDKDKESEAEIELKRVVDKQCALEFVDLSRQLDAKILECTNLEEKNTSLVAELRQKSGLEDCNQSLSVELNKNLAVLQSHQPVSDITLAKMYEDLLAAHEDIKKKLITKEDFRQKLVNVEERMKSLEANNSEWHKKLVNSEERKKTLEVDNNEWEIWRQALKKALASEGMGDMGDPTFKELYEQNERFFTIEQQGPKGDGSR
ncbi:hypothetical protein GIB67_016730 [Kingdonia uniflora]|uniref:Uncharacterized protein n=1 Tax=Kingdonia uniflora TaxID=39325 RepID=A0A7J7LML7_9MAGN|nr:hypothetical protein GIB67_016730 [Kingdonia uniflora]